MWFSTRIHNWKKMESIGHSLYYLTFFNKLRVIPVDEIILCSLNKICIIQFRSFIFGHNKGEIYWNKSRAEYKQPNQTKETRVAGLVQTEQHRHNHRSTKTQQKLANYKLRPTLARTKLYLQYTSGVETKPII